MEKEKFDALHKLAEQAWRDWDHKTKYQWRLAFAIWGAILAAISATITQQIEIPLWGSLIISVALIIIHWFFLGWIEGRIRDCRRQMFQYVSEMESLVGVSTDEITKFQSNMKKEKEYNKSKSKRSWWMYRIFVFRYKPAAAVHLLITLFISLVFLAVTRFPAPADKEPTQQSSTPSIQMQTEIDLAKDSTSTIK